MLVLVSSPVAKCAYKQHRYGNKCIAMGSIYAWAFSIRGVSIQTYKTPATNKKTPTSYHLSLKKEIL